jgi:hypothetical protein
MEISLTDFVDFTLKTGSSRLAKVRELKNRGDYDPATDFWRPLRKGLIELHRAGKMNGPALDAWLGTQTNPKRSKRYAEAIRGYKKFIGKRTLPWFNVPAADWREGELTVRVNPEFGLEVDGKPTITKLYFKNEAPTRARVEAVHAVLEVEFGTRAKAGTRFAVLDVNIGRLMLPDERWSKSDMKALLNSEARAFVDIWNAI